MPGRPKHDPMTGIRTCRDDGNSACGFAVSHSFRSLRADGGTSASLLRALQGSCMCQSCAPAYRGRAVSAGWVELWSGLRSPVAGGDCSELTSIRQRGVLGHVSFCCRMLCYTRLSPSPAGTRNGYWELSGVGEAACGFASTTDSEQGTPDGGGEASIAEAVACVGRAVWHRRDPLPPGCLSLRERTPMGKRVQRSCRIVRSGGRVAQPAGCQDGRLAQAGGGGTSVCFPVPGG